MFNLITRQTDRFRGVQLLASDRTQLVERLLDGQRLAVRTRRRHHRERIADGEDPRDQGAFGFRSGPLPVNARRLAGRAPAVRASLRPSFGSGWQTRFSSLDSGSGINRQIGLLDALGTMAATKAPPRRLDQQDSECARIEDLLTERPTLAIPRLCHNA